MADVEDDGARDFLRQAAMAIQRYDLQGRALIPEAAWPSLLDDLRIEARSNAAGYLTDFMEATGDGFISYDPLLEKLGAVPRDQARRGPGDDYGTPPRQQFDEPEDFRDAGGPIDYDKGYDCSGPPTMSPDDLAAAADRDRLYRRPQAPSLGQMGDTGQIRDLGSPPESPNGSYGQQSPSGRDAQAFEDEDGETFWQRRAGTIQRLFQLWDCNQLTNDMFTAQLQDVLGDRVNVTDRESEFQMLTNKHRSARNLKFAMLTSALRRDYRSTLARRMGISASQLGSLAPSYAGSNYAPSNYGGGASNYGGSVYDGGASEAGSEAPSHAAGRPTGHVASASSSLGSAGRRHYGGSDYGGSVKGNLQGGSAPIPTNVGRGHPNTRAAAQPLQGIAEYSPLNQQVIPSAVPNQQPRPTQARDPAPYASDTDAADRERLYGGGGGGSRASGSDAGGYGGRAALQLDNDYWHRTDPRLPGYAGGGGKADDQCDAVSQSDAGNSVADSQRHLYTHRNRVGHGNILAWGADNSRNITPERKRGGRQLTVDPSSGVPRSQATAGVFNHNR